MQTLQSFIAEHRLGLVTKPVSTNPNMLDMPAGSRHWKCVIKRAGLRMTIYFSQGPALVDAPTLEDILNCLASDAAGYENARSFEEWCGEYGYDTDSRKAETTWKAIGRQVSQLKRLLPNTYQQLLYATERL